MAIRRKVTKEEEEELELHKCPSCNSDIVVQDCGYTSFNIGWAQCKGCKLKWTFEYVKDAWNCGERWNAKAIEVTKNLQLFQLLKVDRKSLINRDYNREDLEDAAEKLLMSFKSSIIDADTDPE